MICVNSGKRAKDLGVVILVTIVADFVFAPSALAYVDPSVMTYTIQALAGVAVALSAVLGVAFRRVRKKLVHVFNIDEDANKLVEHDIHALAAEDAGEHTEAPSAEAVSTDEIIVGRKALEDKRVRQAQRLRLGWPKRFFLALLASFFFLFTAFVSPATDLVAGGAASLTFGLADVLPLVATAALVCAVVLSLVLSAFRGRAFDIALALVVALGLCMYVQALFLNTGLPAADGRHIDWSGHFAISAVSIIVWVAIIVAAIVVSVKKRPLGRGLAIVLCAALLLVQGAGTASLMVSPAYATSLSGNKVTEDGLFTVSEKSNVIVFVLDTVDTQEIRDMQVTNPEMFDSLKGFTFYENSAGGMIPTRYGVPLLLTGVTPQGYGTSTEWFNDRYPSSTYLDDIKDAGYSIGIYTDSINWGEDYVAQRAMNVHPISKEALDKGDTLATLAECSLYRDLPWVAKPALWYTTDDVNRGMTKRVRGSRDAETPYVMGDARYYDKLVDHKLTTDDEGENGAFRFIHLLGAHKPYTMDENAHEVGDGNSTLERQTEGSFTIVSQYMDQLKALGLYDDATIIITADHGYWDVSMDVMPEISSPVILVKPAHQDAAAATAPLQISQAPVTHTDLLPTVIEAVGGDASHYGLPIEKVPDQDRERYFYFVTHDGRYDYFFKEYAVDGYALDFENWHLTGREWESFNH